MNSRYLLLLLTLFGTFGGFAQEVISPLTCNPALLPLQTHMEQGDSRHADAEELIERFDTLNLPFIDDFSTNRLRSYSDKFAKYWDRYVIDSCSFDSSTVATDTFYHLKDTAFQLTFDPSDSTLDSFVLPRTLFILVYDTPNCDIPEDTLWFWTSYYRFTQFDTLTGNPTDTVWVDNDTFSISKLDTQHFVNPDTTALWADNYAYLNNSYPIDPPTIGVATLDGLNEFGAPYSSTSMAYGEADFLTSMPINLAKPPGDSIYLSFFYQPMGWGDVPQDIDSLTVEFLSSDGTWKRQWGVRGDSTRDFEMVMLPLKDAQYLYKGFQFRFKNYATLSGNNDHWHVDFVYMDTLRSAANRSLNDVGISKVPVSMLEEYFAMPWHQYIANASAYPLLGDITFTMNNLDDLNSSTDYKYESVRVDPMGDVLIIKTDSQNVEIIPFNDTIRSQNYVSAFPSFGTLDSALIRTTVSITERLADNNITSNDQVNFDQPFYNYYAYDDGSAERAYGLFGSGSQFALEFNLNVPDTIRAVQFHWAQMNVDVSLELFSLRIWQSIDHDNSGSGDSILYQEDFLQPQYVDSVNGFYTYLLEEPVAVSDKFYVGWLQSGEPLLNIGFDLHRDATAHAYFNSTGLWGKSQIAGSVMIRPLMKQPLPDWINYHQLVLKPLVLPPYELQLFPNPANDVLNLRLEGYDVYDTYGCRIEMFDATGRLIATYNNFQNFLNVSKLSPGVYLLRVIDTNDEKIWNKKFIKTR